LYVRAEEHQRRRFSEVIARGVADPRLYTLMSMRADFLGELQKDEPLFKVHRKIDVPPLREAELREVVTRPAELLSARFETAGIANIITRRTSEDSAKDVGALPLLSTLDDMWAQMVKRDDGVLRLPAQSFELGGVLVSRADAFLYRPSGVRGRASPYLHLEACHRASGRRADAAACSALRVHRRGVAAGQRACQSPKSPSRDGNTRGRGDLC
jgi:hypothetical protein